MSIWILVAAAVANPPVDAEAIGNPARGWVRGTDIPESEWKQRASVRFDLTIDAQGRPMRCEILHSSGSETLDTTVCKLLMKRAHFKPARDASGRALPSVMRNQINWRPNRYGENYQYEAADIVVSTGLPLNKKPVLVEIVQVIEASGKVEMCHATSRPAKIEQNQLACSAANRPEIAIPVKDASGAPVRGIRSYNVGFTAGEEGGVKIR